MAVRINLEERAIVLSVADLVGADRHRSIGFGNRGGYERLWVGQAIHSRYQDRALAEHDGYRKEVTVNHELAHRGWAVTVAGRIDGLRREADGTLVVEEIKSVRRGSARSEAVRDSYAAQACLYAWMLHEQGEELVAAELIWIEIGGHGVERERLDLELADIGRQVRGELDRILDEHASRQRRREVRRQAAADLQFPYTDLRPGQAEILEAVETALEQREHLLLEAPTGIGKTVAAIYPALRHALEHDRKVYVLTAKNLQQEMATTVLELLNSERSFHAVRLRAKAAMCANDELICHEEYCRFARDYSLKLQGTGVVEQLMKRWGTLTPDLVYMASESAEVCPFEVSLELTGSAQVVVCDYNYAFDPYIALRDFGPEGNLGDAVLIIDEIHNLVGRGRGYYSPGLAMASTRTAAADLAARGSAKDREIAHLCGELGDLIERVVHGAMAEVDSARAVPAAMPQAELEALCPDFDAAFVDYLELRRAARDFRAEEPFVDLYFELLRFVDVLQLVGRPEFSTCVERDAGDAVLRILCKDPSRYIGAVLARTHAAIGLSATLSPADFYLDLLGFERHRTVVTSVPSPFPAENREIVIDPTIETVFRKRQGNYPLIAERLSALTVEVPGNCLALFPSYEFLSRVAELLEVDGKRVLVQRRVDGHREREAILETLRSAILGDVLLLAVAGGVFAEGVDYPGDMLKAVVVVSPCLPGLSLEQSLLREYYEERFDRGFEYSSVVPGMVRVVQAAGRLIRSPDDTGVIVLLGRRFLIEPYCHHLPAAWLSGRDLQSLAGDPVAVTRRFFARTAQRA